MSEADKEIPMADIFQTIYGPVKISSYERWRYLMWEELLVRAAKEGGWVAVYLEGIAKKRGLFRVECERVALWKEQHRKD